MMKKIFLFIKEYLWIVILILLVLGYLELDDDNKGIKREVRKLRDRDLQTRIKVNQMKKQVDSLKKEILLLHKK